MPLPIKIKRSQTTGNVPGSLLDGEIAINVSDKKIWVGNTTNNPVLLYQESLKQNSIQFKDEGLNIGTTGLINSVDFVGAGVVASTSGNNLTVTISGGGGAVTIYEAEIDFGSIAKKIQKFNIINATVTSSSKILANMSGAQPTGKQIDELEFDCLNFIPTSKNGSFDVVVHSLNGLVNGKFKFNYQIG